MSQVILTYLNFLGKIVWDICGAFFGKGKFKMKKKNYMTVSTYYLMIIMLTAVLDIMFYFWGFKNCPPFDRKISLIVFLGISILGTLILTVMSVKHYRNTLSIWCSALFPIEVYCILSYITKSGGRIFILFIVWVLTLIVWILIKHNMALKKEQDFKVGIKLLPELTRAGWLLITAVLLLFIVPVMSRGARGIETALDYTIVATDTKGMTVTGQQSNLKDFDEQTWRWLDEDRRAELLQLVAAIEASELGLDHELYIGIRDFAGDTTPAAYTAHDHKILVNRGSLMSMTGEEAINMVCHQAYHAYEKSLVDLYMDTGRKYLGLKVFSGVDGFVAELQQDIEALDDRKDAANERLEQAAKKYADEKTSEYLYWIDFAIKSGSV